MKRHEKYFTGLTLEGDELFFFLSLIEGDHVGRDNTCKTALELKTTFVDKAPLLHLSDLIKTLKIDMIFLSRDKGTEKELLGCARLLYQAKMYKRLLLDVIHYSHGASDEGQWVKENLGPDTPIHFSRFHPMYKLTDLSPTPLSSLIRAQNIAKQTGLRFIYIGNVSKSIGENTHCPFCRKLLIKRIGYTVLENHIQEGKCSFCGKAIAGIWN